MIRSSDSSIEELSDADLIKRAKWVLLVKDAIRAIKRVERSTITQPYHGGQQK